MTEVEKLLNSKNYDIEQARCVYGPKMYTRCGVYYCGLHNEFKRKRTKKSL
jgi:hypothetical protein